MHKHYTCHCAICSVQWLQYAPTNIRMHVAKCSCYDSFCVCSFPFQTQAWLSPLLRLPLKWGPLLTTMEVGYSTSSWEVWVGHCWWWSWPPRGLYLFCWCSILTRRRNWQRGSEKQKVCKKKSMSLLAATLIACCYCIEFAFLHKWKCSLKYTRYS